MPAPEFAVGLTQFLPLPLPVSFPSLPQMLISKAPTEKHPAFWSPSQSLLPRGAHYNNSQGTVPVLRCSLSHAWWYFHPQGLHLWDSASTRPYLSSTCLTWSSKTMIQQVSPLNKRFSTQWSFQANNWILVNSQWVKKKKLETHFYRSEGSSFLSLPITWLGQGTGLYLEHEIVSHTTNPLLIPDHPWEKTYCSPFCLRRIKKMSLTEAKLELWSHPCGLISYRLTFNCCFFLSNFNQNASYVLPLTALNNWPFFALLSSLFSPHSPNKRGFSAKH